MPLYDFRCKKCDRVFDKLCSFADSKKVKCECGSKKVEKLISSFAVTFSNPTDTSKFDSFGYRAGFNMEKAKTERRVAGEKSHVGRNPYG